MDVRIAIVLDRNGRIAQTAVLAEDHQSRSEGHHVLHLIEPEIAVFADRVSAVLERERRLN